MPMPRLFQTSDSQTDPFNAGDPVMPGGEPEPFGGEADLDPAPGYAALGAPGGAPHKPGDDYQAPISRGDDYDAPSTDEPPAPETTKPRPRPGREAAGARGGRRRVGVPGHRRRSPGRGCAVSLRAVIFLIVAVTLLESLIGGVASCVADLTDGASSGWLGTAGEEDYVEYAGEEDYVEYAGDEESERAAAALDARLGALLADPSSGELHEMLVVALDERLGDFTGRTSDELGIDADAWATGVLESVSYANVEAYAYEDSHANAYLDAWAPDAGSFTWDASSEVLGYLSERGLEDPGTTLRAQDLEGVSRVFGEQAERLQPAERFLGVDLELVDGEWVLGDEELERLGDTLLCL